MSIFLQNMRLSSLKYKVKKKEKKDAAPFQPPFHIKVGDGVGSEIGGLSSVKLTHIIDFESHKE